MTEEEFEKRKPVLEAIQDLSDADKLTFLTLCLAASVADIKGLTGKETGVLVKSITEHVITTTECIKELMEEFAQKAPSE